MWFTPPKLPPLGLKLKSLEGGGRSPAVFCGETEDGHPVYVRYRGGWIHFHQGEIGASNEGPLPEVIAARIGPPLDGSMVVEQACEILGLDVPGMRPVSHDVLMEGRRGDPVCDLSGDTTFWDAFIYTTEAGVPDILGVLSSLDRPFMIIAMTKDRGYQQIASISDAHYDDAWFGFNPADGALDAMRGYDPERRQEFFSALLHVRRFRRFRGKVEYGPDYGFERSNAFKVHFSLQCPTAPGPQRDAAEAVVAAIRSRVGTQVDLIDVEARQVVRQDEVWYSREVRDWCLGDPNRVIAIKSDDTDVPGKYARRAMRPAG